MAEQTNEPKVFISYSWTNDDHVGWVRTLAERLRSDGVDVILDRWDLKEGQDKYVFMEQMVTESTVTKVLAICDKAYAEKADGRRGGVGTESLIISKDVYEKVRQEKFIPLLRERDEGGAPCLPVFFRSRIYIDFCDDDGFGDAYDQLIRNLYGRPELKKPPLGQPPAYLFKESVTHVRPAGKLQRLKEGALKGKPHAEAFLTEYLDCFLDSLEDFRIRCAGPADREFDEKVLESVASFTPYRDNFLEFAQFAAAYMDQEGTYEAVHEFLERLLPFQERPAGETSWYEVSTDNYRFIVYELFLYWLAALIRGKRYAAAARFIEGTYHCRENRGGGTYRSRRVDAFYEPIQSLDDYRMNRLQLRLPSVTAETVKARATSPKLPFHDLYQVDVLLFIRPFFPEPGGASNWWPRLIPYGQSGSLELFAKATSERGLAPLRHLLKVKSLPDLVGKVEAMFQDPGFQHIAYSGRWHSVDFGQILSLNSLQKAARPKA